MPSVRRGTVGGTLDQPYFFLSYARRDDRAAYVGRFYNDLLNALGLPVTGSVRQPAFRDVENIMLGDDWLLELSRAVGSCRAMVSLYSPAYFRSEYCGKEWTHFAARVKRYQDLTSVQPRALVPVIWEPVSQDRMPPEVVLPATSEGCAHFSAGPVGPAEDRPRGVTAHSALGHVLRRLEREAADPTAPHLAEFESSIDFETPMW